MEFSNYQNQAIRITHPKKLSIMPSFDEREQLIDETGDMLYDITVLCYELNTTLETVALRNLAKLRKRQRSDSGDD